MSRATVLRVYAVFAVALVAAVAFVVLSNRYEDRQDQQQGANWDAANNRWREGYDWAALNRTHDRLVTARIGAGIAVAVGAMVCAVVSALHAPAHPWFWLAAALFAALAILMALALLSASAFSGGGMIGTLLRARWPIVLALVAGCHARGTDMAQP